ncbi:MAG: tandem-95 repeat protein, partial [Proteobacteria bacterium]|nr:tandem-95 repeat protein [Pseudomonadota bacterium]
MLKGQDPNGDVLSFTVVVPPQFGTLLGDGANIQYLPDNYYAGSDHFEFTVDDGSLGSLPATIDIEVADQNNAPQFVTLPALPFVLEPASGDGEPVDLTQWTSVDLLAGSQPQANWTVNDTGTVATQIVNSKASAFISDFDLDTDQIEGTWRVNTNNDDDFIGFVFGYQNPYQFYVFDWKKNTQNTALRGMTVKAVNLAPDGSEGIPALWNTNHAKHTTLFHNSVPWTSYTDYQFFLTFHPGQFSITVKRGNTVLESVILEDDTFSSGDFGFYNFSQDQVEYSGFTREVLSSREFVYAAEAVDPDGDQVSYTLLSGPDGMALDSATGLLRWQTTSADAGTYSIAIEATDTQGVTSVQRFELVVVEQVPVIVTEPGTEAVVDQPYVYDVAAIDPNPNDVLAFTLEQGPAGMLVAAPSGVLDWTPTLADLGPHDVVVRVTDTGGFFSEQAYVLNVVESPTNFAPVITSEAVTAAQVGGSYSYTPTATDADGDPVTFSLVDVPYGMQMFDGQTITWTPTADQVTRHTVLIEVEDGNGGIAEQTFTIDVTGASQNHAPTIQSQPGNAIQSGGEYEYRMIATDADGDELVYSLTSGPAGMVTDSLGVTYWMPVETGYYPVAIRVEDGRGGYTTQSFDIAVSSTLANDAPDIHSVPTGTAYLGARYDYRLQATDADGDPLVYSAVTAPTGLSIDAYTGVVDWVPGDAQLGDHSVVFKAYDGRGGSTTQSYTLTVLALSNDLPPQITSTPGTAAEVGVAYSYQLLAQDPEGALLVYTLDSGPAGMTMDAAGVVTWTPLGDQQGLHSVVVTASDDAGGTATQTYTLAVDDGTGLVGNLPPVISSTPPNQVAAGAPYQYPVIATDPEAGSLTYQLTQAPGAMAIDASGLINWTPQTSDIGSYVIEVEVSDAGGATTQQLYTLSVTGTAINQAPLIVSQPSNSGKVGLTYQTQMVASDADGDAISYILSAGPAGAGISATGLLTWTPAAAGTETMTVRVSDGIAWAELTWLIQVVSASTVLGADILLTPEVADAGESITIQVVPTGNAGAVIASIAVD